MESPPRFSFPELQYDPCLYSEMSSCTSTPFVSAPSSPSRMKGFYFSAPTSPTWANRVLDMVDNNHWEKATWHPATGHGLPDADKAAYDFMEADKTGQQQGLMENRATKTEQQGLVMRRSAKTEHGSSVENRTHGLVVKTGNKTERGSMESLADKREPRLSLRPLRIDTSHRTPLIESANGDGDSYSRKSFYASAIPFSWEEKPGTPKASERNNNNGYASFADDEEQHNNREHGSILHSGSSEFEFSSRFSEIEDPPTSPTPILSSSAFSSRWPDPQPLRPPPRLQTPVRDLIKEDTSSPRLSPKPSCISLSAPQSPRSPFKHGIRGVFCGLSNPGDGVFDPFLVAMEKMASSDVKKDVESKDGHHRRAHSYTPLRIFEADEQSTKPESATSAMDDDHHDHIKVAQPASHQSRTKGSKRWSFKGILHRKSSQSSNPSSLRSNSSCSSSMGETGDVIMDDNNNKLNPTHIANANANPKLSSASLLSSASSSSSSSSSSSGNSTNGRRRLNQHHRSSNNKGLYALHYNMQRAQTEELRKKTFLPYKQSLLGCLGISSKSYRAIAALSKPVQPVS